MVLVWKFSIPVPKILVTKTLKILATSVNGPPSHINVLKFFKRKLNTPETSGRLSNRISGIIWVIFVSYNWLKVTLETTD